MEGPGGVGQTRYTIETSWHTVDTRAALRVRSAIQLTCNCDQNV